MDIDKALNRIVEFELIPLLKEYWFDDPVKVKNWTDNLRVQLSDTNTKYLLYVIVCLSSFKRARI